MSQFIHLDDKKSFVHFNEETVSSPARIQNSSWVLRKLTRVMFVTGGLRSISVGLYVSHTFLLVGVRFSFVWGCEAVFAWMFVYVCLLSMYAYCLCMLTFIYLYPSLVSFCCCLLLLLLLFIVVCLVIWGVVWVVCLFICLFVCSLCLRLFLFFVYLFVILSVY